MVIAFFSAKLALLEVMHIWQRLQNNKINVTIFYNIVQCALAENWQHVTAYTHWY